MADARDGPYMPLSQAERAPAPAARGLRWSPASAVFGAVVAAVCLQLRQWGSPDTPISSATAELASLPGGEEEAVISLPEGRVRGLQSRAWGRIFRGIPYAEAGRWRNPEPVKHFPKELDATRFRDTCMRGAAQNREDVSEDCLFLNVYTPRVVPGSKSLAPVLVWFHGGSFTMGAGSDTHIEDVKELTATRHLVVVTINYRLGIFGFLGSERMRMGSAESVGNFGILDQQMALHWVRKNIAHFGGDVSRVTLVGWSAGAASISNHLVMESSAGLFASAIMMSGGFTDWAATSMETSERDYQAVVRAAGCEGDAECWAPGPPCDCLSRLSSEQLLGVQARTGIGWAPTVDGTHLKMHPMDALAAGAVNPGVPIVIGGTRQDCLKDIGANATRADFETFAGMPVGQGGLGLGPDDVEQASRIYIQGGHPPEENGLDRWSRAYWAARNAGADKTMLCVARRAAMAWRGAAGAPSWWYVWGNMPAERYGDPPTDPREGPLKVGGCWPCPGATHGSDLPFLFERIAVNIDDARANLADIYQVMFANMMWNRNPNQWKGLELAASAPDPEQEELSLAWPEAQQLGPPRPAAPATGMWFDAGSVRSIPGLKSAECDFWDEVR